MKPSQLVKGKQYWVHHNGRDQLMIYEGSTHPASYKGITFYKFQKVGSTDSKNRIGLVDQTVQNYVHEPHKSKPKYTQLALI